MMSQGDDLNFLILNTRSDWDRGLSVGLQTADAGLTLVPLTASPFNMCFEFAKLLPHVKIP
jgi:hypothetical protein